MPEQVKKAPCCTGLLAHVGASRRAPHTNNESPVRKPGISYAEVSLHRGDMMDLRYWQKPQKVSF